MPISVLLSALQCPLLPLLRVAFYSMASVTSFRQQSSNFLRNCLNTKCFYANPFLLFSPRSSFDRCQMSQYFPNCSLILMLVTPFISTLPLSIGYFLCRLLLLNSLLLFTNFFSKNLLLSINSPNSAFRVLLLLLPLSTLLLSYKNSLLSLKTKNFPMLSF